MHNKLKLVGDGTSQGTQLIDVATGENILSKYGFDSIKVEMNSVSLAAPKVTLELFMPLVEIALNQSNRSST